GLGDELLLLRLRLAQHLGDLALGLRPGLLDGAVVLLPEARDLGFELTRRGHLALRANGALLEQPERRIEPQPFEREPQHHEDQGFNDKAVVQIEHAERRAAKGGRRAGAGWRRLAPAYLVPSECTLSGAPSVGKGVTLRSFSARWASAAPMLHWPSNTTPSWITRLGEEMLP